jgi:signal transduction histidine kinase
VSSTPEAEADLGYRQALRYAQEIRELYQQERARADEIQQAKDAIERKQAELEAVREVSEAVGSSLELSQVLEAAMDHATSLTGLSTATVRLMDEQTNELVMTAHRNLPLQLVAKLERVPVDSPLGELILGDGTPHLVKDAFADERLSIREDLERAGYSAASTVHAPMHWGRSPIGVISLASLEGREVTEADLSLLTAISRPIAAAIGNARLYETLRQMDAARRALLARLVRAQEEERQTIASDIHDDSIQVMTAVGMRLYSLRKRLTDLDQLAALDEFARTLSEATSRLRSLMFELRPPALDREGLGAALRLYLENNEDEQGPAYELEDRLITEMSPEVRAVVYRIAQEALTNIRKHAQAKRVHVLLEPMGVGVRVRIADDGVGLPPGQSDRSAPGHLGLTAMRERAELAAGWWRIESPPGGGTVVEFWIPGDPDDGERWEEEGA